MIALFLITGFLGSGKTTLLQRIIKRNRDRRLVYLVNEFGSVDIDGQLLKLEPGQLVSIPGGSIFCRCLTSEFIRVLQTIGADHADGVVIEASGIADPKVIGQMLAETRLDNTYELRQIITVVDPGSFLKLIHTLPSIIAQIEAADLAIINKSDLYTAEQLEAAEHKVREINPPAKLVRTQRCQIDLDIEVLSKDGDTPRRSLKGQYALCVDPNYVTKIISFDKPVDLAALMRALRSLSPHIYRVKGFVPTINGLMYVDVSGGQVTCTPATNTDIRCALVCIAKPSSLHMIEAELAFLLPKSHMHLL